MYVWKKVQGTSCEDCDLLGIKWSICSLTSGYTLNYKVKLRAVLSNNAQKLTGAYTKCSLHNIPIPVISNPLCCVDPVWEVFAVEWTNNKPSEPIGVVLISFISKRCIYGKGFLNLRGAGRGWPFTYLISSSIFYWNAVCFIAVNIGIVCFLKVKDNANVFSKRVWTTFSLTPSLYRCRWQKSELFPKDLFSIPICLESSLNDVTPMTAKCLLHRFKPCSCQTPFSSKLNGSLKQSLLAKQRYLLVN